MKSRTKVLLIEDSKIDQMAFKRLVREKSLAYDYEIASSVAAAAQILQVQSFDIILCDHQLGDGTAFDIFNLQPQAPVIIITGNGSESVAVRAMKAGAYDYLSKDINGNYLEILPLIIATAIRHQQAEAQSQLLSHALEQINDSVCVANTEDQVIFVNQAFCETYGYKSEDILGKNRQILWCDDQKLACETSWERIEVNHRRQNGSCFPASVSRSILNHEGQQLNVFISHDITPRKVVEAQIKQLNKNLQQRTVELEVANKELEAFSHSVSHDLCNPLTSIKGFLWLLRNGYYEQLDSKGQTYVQEIEQGTRRMQELIKDLLNLSRITQAEIRQETVNLSKIALSICFSLQQRQPQRQVEFAIAPNIHAQGDVGLLKIVLENLLDNAWKYSNKREVARIEFGMLSPQQTMPGGDFCSLTNVYFIRDNGAGFDMAYAHQLFAAFRRLHNLSEFEGTGVGLATVQRIIHRHGGKIWAQAVKEQGATFYFTL